MVSRFDTSLCCTCRAKTSSFTGKCNHRSSAAEFTVNKGETVLGNAATQKGVKFFSHVTRILLKLVCRRPTFIMSVDDSVKVGRLRGASPVGGSVGLVRIAKCSAHGGKVNDCCGSLNWLWPHEWERLYLLFVICFYSRFKQSQYWDHLTPRNLNSELKISKKVTAKNSPKN